MIKNKKTVVITYGTYDLFHSGHEKFLKRAKKYGDYLIVGVSSDEFNAQKGKKSWDKFEIRKAKIKSLPYVDKVIKEKNWNQKETDIKKYQAKYFVIGDDWKGEFDNLNEICQVIYLPRTPNISSTLIKETIEKTLNNEIK